jgi:hypothetical protein
MEEKIKRIKYICSLDDSKLNGSTPTNWLLPLLNEKVIEHKYSYIKVNNSEIGVCFLFKVKGNVLYFSNGSNLKLKLENNILNNIAFETILDYDVSNREEFIENILNKAEYFVSHYELEKEVIKKTNDNTKDNFKIIKNDDMNSGTIVIWNVWYNRSYEEKKGLELALKNIGFKEGDYIYQDVLLYNNSLKERYFRFDIKNDGTLKFNKQEENKKVIISKKMELQIKHFFQNKRNQCWITSGIISEETRKILIRKYEIVLDI